MLFRSRTDIMMTHVRIRLYDVCIHVNIFNLGPTSTCYMLYLSLLVNYRYTYFRFMSLSIKVKFFKILPLVSDRRFNSTYQLHDLYLLRESKS